MLEYGAHATKYYALEVSHFKSTLDTLLLEQLWDKYWVQTLSQSPLFSNREFSTKRMRDLNNSMMNITDEMAHAHALGSHVGGNGGSGGKSASEAAVSATGGPSSMSGSRQIDVNIENLATDMHAAVMRELTGLAAFETKALLFHGGA
jgi:COP9 signalosome complex subunit 5